LSSRVIL